MLSWMLLEGEVIVHDYADARKWAQAAAEQGIASSMTRLGMLYHNALGVERDAKLSAHWWRRDQRNGARYWKKPLASPACMPGGMRRS